MILKNKNIFVTGVGKGIGLDLLKTIISEGGFVYGLTRSKKDIKNIKNVKNCKVFFGDVRDQKIIKKIFLLSIKEKRIIHGIVNNAGVRQRIKFDELKEKKLRDLFEINFFSVFRILKSYFSFYKKRKVPCSIINIGSIVGEIGFEGLTGYAATKTALIGLTKSLAVEKAKEKIRVNLLCPGFIKTSYFNKFKKKKFLYKWTLSRIPVGRWGLTSEITKIVCFLLSDNSSYINGQIIKVDGGWSAS